MAGGDAGKTLFCFGFGYSARALARRLATAGWRVAGTTRSGTQESKAAGAEIVRFDGTAPLDARGRALLAGATHLLASIPPGGDGDPALALHGEDIARASRLRWIGYLSTTGVYGDRDGAWVDEDTPPAPATPRARRRLAAEEAWRSLGERSGIAVQIFRLAGIYGPGRSPFEALAEGRARRIDRPGQVFSRIHVEDIARVLEASIVRPRAGAVYNVCDDLPAPAADVVAYAARKMGIPPPPLVPIGEADLSPMARSFYKENRRVSNRRIKEELGVRLACPDYRAGLDALAAQRSRRR